MSSVQRYLIIGALLGFLTVALGAFGAHGLKNLLSTDMLVVYNKAVHYQGLHTLGLLITGLLLREQALPHLRWAARLFTLGILLFCGSLYFLAITQNRMLGAITPLGGLSFLGGWLFLAMGCWKAGK
ncbi:MAG TPA: DUF423 domain-containing protein [Thiolapillus brandeum]|uniref:DUF423 domain-containing protein n=1 Tax=Thiolapillus brandeum TaxID=1076588 RepID=A0A831NZ06_9GAMM|nr:DUF423 domain-containing protein [Thiolapillus brandeum]